MKCVRDYLFVPVSFSCTFLIYILLFLHFIRFLRITPPSPPQQPQRQPPLSQRRLLKLGEPGLEIPESLLLHEALRLLLSVERCRLVLSFIADLWYS